MTDLDKMARELLANCLDDFGHPQEARNVRDGEDLESYEVELRLIRKLHTYGCLRLTSEPLTTPSGYVLVPESIDPVAAMDVLAGNGLGRADEDADLHQVFGWLLLFWKEYRQKLAAAPEVK